MALSIFRLNIFLQVLVKRTVDHGHMAKGLQGTVMPGVQGIGGRWGRVYSSTRVEGDDSLEVGTEV